MKLAHLDIESQFLNERRINILTVENAKLFRELCQSMKIQSEGGQGAFVLSENEEILSIAKYGLYISDYFNLDLSDRKYISKLYSMISEDSDSKFSIETADAISRFCALIDMFNSECEIPLSYDEATPLSSLLKAFNVKPQSEYSSYLEKFVSYIDAIGKLSSTKLFCFVNLKANFSDEEIEHLYQYFLSSEMFVFSIESSLRNKRIEEFNALIDNDLCEIIF